MNELGRPLEFHCTTPVRPSRAQEILYGATLPAFLLGEYIGRTLIEKAKAKLSVLLTERTELLEVRRWIETPAACVLPAETPVEESPLHFAFAGYSFVAAEADAGRIDSLRTSLSGGAGIDWCEPFERIHEAIGEAQRGARQAPAA